MSDFRIVPTVRSRHALGLPAGALVALTLVGCGNVQTVNVNDRDATVGQVRATSHTNREGRRPAGPGMELGYEGYNAKDSQILLAGQAIVLEGGTFVGPMTLGHKAEVRQAHVAYNHRLLLGEHVELEPFVGLARFEMKLHSTPSGAATVRGLEDHNTVLLAGVQPRWRFNEWVALDGRISLIRGDSRISGTSYEVALAFSPVPQVALRLGYSDRRYDTEWQMPGVVSEVKLRSRGPMATLQFDF